MIKDVRKYRCDRDECLCNIKDSVKSCTRKELVSGIPHSDLQKMDKNIRNIFFECNYDELGNVYLFDEINPKLISEYIVNNIELEVGDDIVYKYVCRTQMRVINAFYKEIKEGEISWNCPLNSSQKIGKNNKLDKYRDKYIKLVKNRLDYPIKIIRGV